MKGSVSGVPAARDAAELMARGSVQRAAGASRAPDTHKVQGIGTVGGPLAAAELSARAGLLSAAGAAGLSGVPSVLGIDAGTVSQSEADHLLTTLVSGLGLPGEPLAATHFVRVGTPHIALSIEVPAGIELDLAAVESIAGPTAGISWRDLRRGPENLAEGAQSAAAAHGRSGRLVHFPGISTLTGTVTVREILDRTPIAEVSILMGAPASPETEVLTRDHIRPEWRDGSIVLVVQPAAHSRVAPFEVPNPTPCCANH